MQAAVTTAGGMPNLNATYRGAQTAMGAKRKRKSKPAAKRKGVVVKLKIKGTPGQVQKAAKKISGVDASQ